jgi:hypothetical protein
MRTDLGSGFRESRSKDGLNVVILAKDSGKIKIKISGRVQKNVMPWGFLCNIMNGCTIRTGPIGILCAGQIVNFE